MSTTTTGNISVLPNGKDHTVQVLTDLVTTTLSGEQTGNAFSVFKTTVPPGGGPPLHRHPPAETFYVLAGEITLLGAGGTQIAGRPGDTVHVPSGEPHSYRNDGTETAHMLAILQPGGYEAFFDELGVPADGRTEPQPPTGPPDLEHLMEVTRRHGVEMLG